MANVIIEEKAKKYLEEKGLTEITVKLEKYGGG